jgi:hypothetical protein
VRRPQRLRIERRPGVGDDRRDRVGNARCIPRLVDQRPELRRLIEHSASLRDGRFDTVVGVGDLLRQPSFS